MIGYQLATAIRELVALRARAVLLVLLVLVVNITLPYTLDSVMRGVNNVQTAASLGASDVTYFSMYYDDGIPAVINDPVNDLLTTVLDGKSADYSVIKNNYFYDQSVTTPVVVALGGFEQAYNLPMDSADQNAVFIGNDVHDYQVGDTIDFGDISATVSGSLPPGTSYLDPWTGHQILDDAILLVSTYERFSAAVPSDVWQEEALGRAVLFDAPDTLVTSFVKAAASTGGLGLVPRSLESRVADVYRAQVERNAMFLIFFAALLAVLGVTLVLALDSLMSGNVRRHSIERLYGATLRHLLWRSNLFVLMTFSLPVLLIFGGFALIADSIANIYPAVVAIVIATQCAMSTRAIVQLRRSSIVDQLRKD